MKGNVKSTERRTRSRQKCVKKECKKLALVGSEWCAKHLTNIEQSRQLTTRMPEGIDKNIDLLEGLQATGLQVVGFDEDGFFIPERKIKRK